jgi:hypothetical protein
VDKTCFYCGITLTKPPSAGRGGHFKKGFHFPQTMYTRDHVVPQCKGGREFVAACFKCNNDKALLSLEEFRIIVGYRLNLEDWHHGSFVFYGERV